MSGTEQQYYEMLTRTDHPVFFKDFSASQNVNSPLNSIWNRILANQFLIFRSILDEFQLNLVPSTVTEMTIDDWELDYFGFTKRNLPLVQRIAELLIKFNKRFTMSVSDVISLCQAITGQTPLVVRNVSRNGWVIGGGALGATTVLSTSATATARGLYLVALTKPVSSNFLSQLDSALSGIEKAGSHHVITSPIQHWQLGLVALGINTTL